MSSDDESRRRRQAFQGAISPAGVGTSVSNQVSPDTLQNLLDTDLTGQALQDANIDLDDWSTSWDMDLGDGAPDPLLTSTGIGSQIQNSPRSMGTPASHISVPSAGGSRNATGVGSVQGNRTRNRNTNSPPRANVPGARGGRARQGRGPRVRGGLTRGSARSQSAPLPTDHPRNGR